MLKIVSEGVSVHPKSNKILFKHDLFDQLLQLFKDSVEKVIGEDEKPDEYIAKHLTEGELDMVTQAVEFHGKNALRKEQRQNLSKILSEEKGNL